LTNGQSNWPVTLYLMYQTYGVEAVASYPVAANLSSLKFTFPPWNATSLNVSVNVPPSAGVLQTSQAGTTLFVLASQYPTQVAYTLDIDGENDLVQGTASLVKGYSTVQEQIGLGLLMVHVLSNRDLTTTLNVTAVAGVSFSRGHVGVNQTASFLLPTGAYTVTASQANKSQSAQTTVKDGLEDSLTLAFQTAAGSSAGSSYAIFEIILIVTAVVAAIANVAVRVLHSRSPRARMKNASKPAKDPEGHYDPTLPIDSR
jgi:hypothetical protein